MKKIMVAFALFLGSQIAIHAQAPAQTAKKVAEPKKMEVVKKADDGKAKVVDMKAKTDAKTASKVNAAEKPVAKTAEKAVTAKPAVPKTTTSAGPLKKDGTPDKRYNANKHLKKDGSPDMRYKANKK